MRLEAADAEPRQGTLHPIDDARALADQALALAARAFGVLVLNGRDRHHPAVAALAAQPAQEHPQQHRGVEPVGLRPLVLARDRDACRMNDVHVDAARAQPPRQPEAIATGLVGDGDARDRPSALARLVAPALQQVQQSGLGGRELLQRLAFDPRNAPGDEPARLAHLDDRNERAILVQDGEGSAQIV